MSNPPAPNNAGNPGSPSNGEPVVYLVVGSLRRSHGVRGDLLLDVLTDFPERLKPGTIIYLGDQKKPFKITRRRPHNEGLILGLAGITSAEQAANYRTQLVYVPASDRPQLPEGEYYHHQILGLSVLDERGRNLGKVTEIITTGANDVYVVTSGDSPAREVLIPALKQVLEEINLESGILRVRLLPGLVDDIEDIK